MTLPATMLLGFVIKMLSINDPQCSVILVGLVMTGMKDKECIKFMKSRGMASSSVFSKFILKSPATTHSQYLGKNR